MEQQSITFVINGKTYRLSAAHGAALRNIPKADREPLIALLKEIELQDKLAEHAIQRAAAKAGIPQHVVGSATATAPQSNQPATVQQPKPERLGAGDVDDLMARLIMEERRNQKPMPNGQTLYKWMAIVLVAIAVLTLLF